MNLHEIAKRIDLVNTANGFAAPTWENLPTKVMLVITELEEARLAVQPGAEDNLPEELADTAIRLMSILNSIWGIGWAHRVRFVGDSRLFTPIEELLWPVVSNCCGAVEYWRRVGADQDNAENRLAMDNARVCLELALRSVWDIANGLEIMLLPEILKKVDKSAERGKWHGKARADG